LIVWGKSQVGEMKLKDVHLKIALYLDYGLINKKVLVWRCI
jgi:hypothetical protein